MDKRASKSRSRSGRKQGSGSGKKPKKDQKTREELKAAIMYQEVAHLDVYQESGKVWLESAINLKKGIRMKKVVEAEAATVKPTPLEIEQLAISLAQRIDEDEVLNKLRSIEAYIAGARNSQDILYYLARHFPRLKEKTKKVINKMLNYWKTWDEESFKMLFHLTRVFFEAKQKGFELKEVQ